MTNLRNCHRTRRAATLRTHMQQNVRVRPFGYSGDATPFSGETHPCKGLRWRTLSRGSKTLRGSRMPNVVHFRAPQAQALEAARMCREKALTVSMPGDLVSPDCTLRNVWNGTPDNSANLCNCAVARGASAARTSSGLGTVRFIRQEHTDLGKPCLPVSVKSPEYPSEMTGDEAKAVVSENVKLLMKLRYGKENISRFGADTGINIGGAQRALAGGVGIEILAKIAETFDLDTWQMLAPNLGQALKLTPVELEAVRKVREPQQPKAGPMGDRAKQDQPFRLGEPAAAKKGRRREA